MNKIILTGFMGTGKSSLGSLLAEKTGLRLVDTDSLIEDRSQRSVAEIFSNMGESAFRAWEAAIAAELGASDEALVVSTGGGMLLNPANRRAFASDSIFCLHATPQIVYERLKNEGDRPLLAVENPMSEIQRLYAERQPIYSQFRWQIDTADRSLEAIADEIITVWQQEKTIRADEMQVFTPEGFYPILSQKGALGRLGEILEIYGLRQRHIIIGSDDLVFPLYAEQVKAQLPEAAIVMMSAGESAKNLDTVRHIYSEFARLGLDRGGVVIALGGGVVGDTFGYAAATYLRGVRFVQIPTSLLAMVDSSVGGKVGVDVPEGKNLVGAFKQPALVIIDPATLATLPPAEVRAGRAEVLKHGLLSGNQDLLKDLEHIEKHIRTAVQVKIDVVQRDPYEQGERAHLNLGHTFAHAIERVSMYQWRHGDAVAVGLVGAAKLSQRLGLIDAETSAYIESLVEAAGLPTRCHHLNPESIWHAMHTDKKWRDGRSHFIVLKGIAAATSVYDVPSEIVINILEELCVCD